MPLSCGILSWTKAQGWVCSGIVQVPFFATLAAAVRDFYFEYEYDARG